MRKLVCSAIALSAAVTPALASEGDWLSLDKELEALPALLQDATGPKVGGYIVTTYRLTDVGDNDGIDFDPPGDAGDIDDTGDFAVEKARIAVTGALGDTGYEYKLQAEFATGGVNIRDAYIRFPIAGDVKGQFGNFKVPFLRSGLVSSAKLFFLDRTLSGGPFGDRQEGFQVMGTFDQVRWYAGAFDGRDGPMDDYQFAARVEVDLMGESPLSHEGAQGGSDDPSLTVAAAWTDDGGFDDGDAIAIEGIVSTNVYSFQAEIVDYGEGDTGVGGSLGDQTLFGIPVSLADSTPFSVTGTWMLSPDEWEVGLRYDDFDDDDDTNRITVGVNNYLLPNHRLKWQVQYSITATDAVVGGADVDDISQLGVGLVASF